jgi:DivIVA domain-containing protein
LTGDEVRQAKFREKLRGYNPDEVDSLLEEVAKALDAGLSITELVRRTRVKFGTKFRGYHPADVDALLDRLRSGA